MQEIKFDNDTMDDLIVMSRIYGITFEELVKELITMEALKVGFKEALEKEAAKKGFVSLDLEINRLSLQVYRTLLEEQEGDQFYSNLFTKTKDSIYDFMKKELALTVNILELVYSKLDDSIHKSIGLIMNSYVDLKHTLIERELQSVADDYTSVKSIHIFQESKPVVIVNSSVVLTPYQQDRIQSRLACALGYSGKEEFLELGFIQNYTSNGREKIVIYPDKQTSK